MSQQVFAELGPWSLNDVTLAARLVARAKMAPPSSAHGGARETMQVVRDAAFLRDAERDAFLAKVSYSKTKDHLLQQLSDTGISLVECHLQSATARPAFAIFVDARTRAVVLALRGTSNMKDVLTDALATKAEFRRGHAHYGMSLAATWAEKHLKQKLLLLLKRHGGYRLRVVGHSLGGGVAALFSMMVLSEFPELRCVTFGAPAVLSRELSEEAAAFVTTFVFRDDMVPRFSTANVDDVRSELVNHDYERESVPPENKRTLVRLAKESLSRTATSSMDFAAAVSRKYKLASRATAVGAQGKQIVTGAVSSAVRGTQGVFRRLGWFSTSSPKLTAAHGDGDGHGQPAEDEDDAGEGEDLPSPAEVTPLPSDPVEITQRNIRLVPPGALYHIVVAADGSVLCGRVSADVFSSLVISQTMLDDHRLEGIRAALTAAISSLEHPAGNHHHLLAGNPGPSASASAQQQGVSLFPGQSRAVANPYPPPRK